MPDLILHIGLSKCASSTLQRQVFQHEQGYLGTAPGFDPEKNFAKQLQQCTALSGRQTTSKRLLAQWVERVRAVHKQCWPEADRLILSNEVLSGSSRLKERPILSVLSLLSNDLWSDGRVKIVLVLRNQAARLASSYAQGTSCRLNPGQMDFERTVAKRLKSRRYLRLFDYSRLVEDLKAAVGPENLCVLLLEESREMAFWQSLIDFCRLERLKPEAMISSSSEKKNRRSNSDGRWSISQFDPAYCAKVVVDKWLNAIWPAHVQRERRAGFRLRAMKHLEARYRRKADQLADENRETEFQLSPRAKQIIQKRCGSFNDQLAQELGRDLKNYGY